MNLAIALLHAKVYETNKAENVTKSVLSLINQQNKEFNIFELNWMATTEHNFKYMLFRDIVCRDLNLTGEPGEPLYAKFRDRYPHPRYIFNGMTGLTMRTDAKSWLFNQAFNFYPTDAICLWDIGCTYEPVFIDRVIESFKAGADVITIGGDIAITRSVWKEYSAETGAFKLDNTIDVCTNHHGITAPDENHNLYKWAKTNGKNVVPMEWDICKTIK